jgi:Flp pilus assembly protein TadG
MIASRLLHDRSGASAVEFALVAPTFFMFLFLMLDGGRMMFAKQSLNEVATATARCAAIKAPGCETIPNAQSWAVNRGLTRDNLNILAADVNVTLGATCSSVSNMAKATVSVALKKGAMTLLPQSVVPSTLTSVACFPQAS